MSKARDRLEKRRKELEERLNKRNPGEKSEKEMRDLLVYGKKRKLTFADRLLDEQNAMVRDFRVGKLNDKLEQDEVTVVDGKLRRVKDLDKD